MSSYNFDSKYMYEEVLTTTQLRPGEMFFVSSALALDFLFPIER